MEEHIQKVREEIKNAYEGDYSITVVFYDGVAENGKVERIDILFRGFQMNGCWIDPNEVEFLEIDHDN